MLTPARTAIGLTALAAAFALNPSPAAAQSGQFTCTRGPGGMSCAGSLGSGRGTFPQIVHIAAPTDAEEIRRSAARMARWRARCRPVFREDRYGVKRAHYAAPGCDLGKIDD